MRPSLLTAQAKEDYTVFQGPSQFNVVPFPLSSYDQSIAEERRAKLHSPPWHVQLRTLKLVTAMASANRKVCKSSPRRLRRDDATAHISSA